MATRKFAFISPLYFDEDSCIGGGERYPLNMARGVVAADPSCEITLISFGPASIHRRIEDRLTLRVLPIHGRPSHPLDLVSWELGEVVASMDLVHQHQAFTRSAELITLLGRLHGTPICVTDHGGDASDLGKSVGHLELVQSIVAYSQFGASVYSCKNPAIHVIPGGVDTDAFRPPELSIRRRHLLYVGRLLPHKGVDRLIDALPEGVPLILCGRAYDPEYENRLHQLARSKDVTFLKNATDEDLRELYQSAIATVLPSVYEDCFGRVYRAPELMGLTLLESLACGTPVLASTVGALPEYVEDGRTGFLFADLKTLRRRILEMIEDPESADAMGREGRRVVESEYSLFVAGKRLADHYRGLLGSRRGRVA